MPTRRMIDPAFWRSENMAQLTEAQRLLFIGLVSNADDQGRLKAHPSLIRSDVYPYDDKPLDDIKADLEAIEAIGSISIYENGSRRYLQIVNWWTYQKPQWAYPSKIPAPPDWADRLRYRAGNEVIAENWGDGSLPKALPKALPKDPPGSDGQSDSQGDGWPPSTSTSVSDSVRDSDSVSETDSPATPAAQAPVPTPKPHTKHQKKPEPTEKRQASQAMFGALAAVCQIDLTVLTDAQRGALNQSERKLRNIASPDDVGEFAEWWPICDWRGQKGQAPRPHQVRETWGQFVKWRDNGKPRPYTRNGKVSKPVERVPKALGLGEWPADHRAKCQHA